jgi:hypothetical protein
MTEEQFKEFVTVTKLSDWLANALETQQGKDLEEGGLRVRSTQEF